MTEEEAKTKWCPMTRFNYCGDGITDCNREEGDSNCLASKCMMWVWDKVMGTITLVDDEGKSSEMTAPCQAETGRCGLVK